LVELKPLPAVEEPTAAVEGVEELWRVRNMNLTTPCQLTGHISSSRKSWISTLSNVIGGLSCDICILLNIVSSRKNQKKV
jgi:hypothetical protein